MVLAYEPDKESAPLALPRGQIDPQAQLAQYQVDRCSVYLGGLPHDMTEAEVRAMAQRFGMVVGIKFHKKNHSDGSGKVSHSYVYLVLMLTPSQSRPSLRLLSSFAPTPLRMSLSAWYVLPLPVIPLDLANLVRMVSPSAASRSVLNARSRAASAVALPAVTSTVRPLALTWALAVPALSVDLLFAPLCVPTTPLRRSVTRPVLR